MRSPGAGPSPSPPRPISRPVPPFLRASPSPGPVGPPPGLVVPPPGPVVPPGPRRPVAVRLTGPWSAVPARPPR
ncbi:hypothetical protein DLJ47_09010 [Micromonospora sp. S4605]|nr:hypothetical protein DLJ47_09010 [Micromonospora sp. S4605]